MKDAILLLMHQGRSFTQQAAAAAAKLGYALVALSSQPDQPEIPQDTRRHLDDCLVTDSPVLNPADIVGIERRFAERGYAVRAAIATFEAYRLLMADINRRVGARDASAEALRLCLNKFELRQLLARRGLSAVRSYRLSPGSLPSLDQSATWFVKPVRGASSFAAFILRDPSRLGDLDLAELQEQMRQDHKMAAIFMDNFDFLVEEYVEGPEFSFETVLLDEAWHLCVHEKARVERLERTTLEVMSVSPPSSVSREAVLRGADFVARCLGELTGLGLAGVFHVEAKYWEARDRWEIIEINPRMGGSLISDSVEALTGESMLELWMTALALTPAGEPALRARLERASQLRSLRDGGPALATVFLSKYGRKGAVVESIDFSPTRPPRVVKMHASAGTVLDHSDRAICLLDAMWTVDSRELAREIDFLDGHATEHFHVAYRGESAESVLQAHEGGKLEVRSKVPLRTRDELARYYTPGFTRAAQAIAADPGGAYRWSIKGNTVAIVTDGTAVSGLGDLGPEAALPVMEGKALLFKEFAGIDAFPLCLRTTDVDEIVRVVTCVEPAFGGIMLEDISAPRCFAIEDRLRAELAVPVLHDDQHATAVSTVAALINGAAYTGKKMRDLTVVISGAGAAGTSTARLAMRAGVVNIIACDRQGAIHPGRDGLAGAKRWFAEHTNPERRAGALPDVMAGADVLIGLSGPGVVTPGDLRVMAPDPIVFALSNPVPDLRPEDVRGLVAVIGTGRSDYPNQIDCGLCYPGIFRGALDAGAACINDEMKLAAVHAIAGLVDAGSLARGQVVPDIFDGVAPRVAAAVSAAARDSGVARAQRVPRIQDHVKDHVQAHAG